MWYAGAATALDAIGYAFSGDGINWTKHIGNPVIELPDFASDPEVVFDGSTYHMWLVEGGGVWNFSPDVINYATSKCCGTDIASLLFIPAAARAAGTEGSFFQTDVDLNNAGDRPVEYRFWWLERGRAFSERKDSETFTLGAGMSVRYTDVLSAVFGLEPNALGALTIVSSSADLLAMSRAYDIGTGESAGTFGQAIPGVSLDEFVTAGERRRILFASENEDLRFNVGCQNGSNKPVTVVLALFDSERTFLERKEMLLPAFGNDQLNRVLEDYMPVNGYVAVRSDTDGGLFYCYGSVVDNVTNDPMTVLPQ